MRKQAATGASSSERGETERDNELLCFTCRWTFRLQKIQTPQHGTKGHSPTHVVHPEPAFVLHQTVSTGPGNILNNVNLVAWVLQALASQQPTPPRPCWRHRAQVLCSDRSAMAATPCSASCGSRRRCLDASRILKLAGRQQRVYAGAPIGTVPGQPRRQKSFVRRQAANLNVRLTLS